MDNFDTALPIQNMRSSRMNKFQMHATDVKDNFKRSTVTFEDLNRSTHDIDDA